jgi:hypothetical protein
MTKYVPINSHIELQSLAAEIVESRLHRYIANAPARLNKSKSKVFTLDMDHDIIRAAHNTGNLACPEWGIARDLVISKAHEMADTILEYKNETDIVPLLLTVKLVDEYALGRANIKMFASIEYVG